MDVVSDESSSSDGGKGLLRTKVTDGRAQGRLPYTAEEDADMINWVKRMQEAGPLSGMSAQGIEVWKAAYRAGFTRHGWMSMHNRWRRHLASGHAANPTALRTQQEGAQGGGAASSRPLRAALAGKASCCHVVGGAASSPRVGSAASSDTPPSPVPVPLLAQAATAEPQAHPTSTRAVAYMLAELFCQVFKEPAELGQEEAFESAFDGDWVFNSQVHQIRGRGTDLRLGGSSCHFKQLTEKTCELFLFVQLGKLLHVVTGRLSDDRQRLTWNNGNEWRRVRENARFALPREDSDAELRLLRKENQYMRAKLIAAGLS